MRNQNAIILEKQKHNPLHNWKFTELTSDNDKMTVNDLTIRNR